MLSEKHIEKHIEKHSEKYNEAAGLRLDKVQMEDNVCQDLAQALQKGREEFLVWTQKTILRERQVPIQFCAQLKDAIAQVTSFGSLDVRTIFAMNCTINGPLPSGTISETDTQALEAMSLDLKLTALDGAWAPSLIASKFLQLSKMAAERSADSWALDHSSNPNDYFDELVEQSNLKTLLEKACHHELGATETGLSVVANIFFDLSINGQYPNQMQATFNKLGHEINKIANNQNL